MYKKFCNWRGRLTGKQTNLDVINEAEEQLKNYPEERKVVGTSWVVKLPILVAIGVASVFVWKRIQM